ncbi:type II toxin-antitoxin system RelE/ParE family toxin [Sphaerisporangium dianthi]|uniref:Type II toxin-antitoxin system RelE/ParE family toxin n=1 Tax=Sphaerisporangium dianthi TaxID=1436120 RepID=A0ABV9CSY9_9ACTN
MDGAEWEVVLVAEVADWYDQLCVADWDSAEQVEDAIDMLSRVGPTLGRPLVDRIKGAGNHHLKELRPGSSKGSEIRILFSFDPIRRAVLLVAGDKAGNWDRWYDVNLPLAEKRYDAHVAELADREYE